MLDSAVLCFCRVRAVRSSPIGAGVARKALQGLSRPAHQWLPTLALRQAHLDQAVGDPNVHETFGKVRTT
eukprot:13153245-Alexandrium_andersonii.AAC.1